MFLFGLISSPIMFPWTLTCFLVVMILSSSPPTRLITYSSGCSLVAVLWSQSCCKTPHAQKIGSRGHVDNNKSTIQEESIQYYSMSFVFFGRFRDKWWSKRDIDNDNPWRFHHKVYLSKARIKLYLSSLSPTKQKKIKKYAYKQNTNDAVEWYWRYSCIIFLTDISKFFLYHV